jgi:DNA-binding PucR family transcriptional regulator
MRSPDERAGKRGGRRRVHLFDPSPTAALVVAAPDEAARLAEGVLGPVLALPREDRELLLTTLETYLSVEGSAERAGQLLHCHANTVRYRLRRLQDLTGRSLSDLNDVSQLATAAFAARATGSLGDQPRTS